MGDKKNKLTWKWPLINLEWLPDIIGNLDMLIEPSWIGLQREMLANVENKAFGKRIYDQLTTLLIETQIIKEDRRHIKCAIDPNRKSIVLHLQNIFEKSSEPWAQCFRYLWDNTIAISFSNLLGEISGQWGDISEYPIFKQWCEFFQFLGMGILANKEEFFPASAITNKMLDDKNLIEKLIRTRSDPRILSGQDSLHTEADHFAWTKGEDILPISKDTRLKHRIPHEIITDGSSTTSPIEKMNYGVLYWKRQIHETISETITIELAQLIITYKIFIDYFLFGRRRYTVDYLSKNKTDSIREQWSEIPNFRISDNVWKSLPKLFNNITRLSFGILYYRNSLQRIIKPWDYYNEKFLEIENSDRIKNLPIRSLRTKRTISNFIENISAINCAISRIISSNSIKKIKSNCIKLYQDSANFLPKDSIDLKSVLSDASKLIVIDKNEISNFNHDVPINLISDCPEYDKISSCYWVHRSKDILSNPKAIAIQSLKRKLEKLEKQLILDISYFEGGLKDWEEACSKLKFILKKFEAYE